MDTRFGTIGADGRLQPPKFEKAPEKKSAGAERKGRSLWLVLALLAAVGALAWRYPEFFANLWERNVGRHISGSRGSISVSRDASQKPKKSGSVSVRIATEPNR